MNELSTYSKAIMNLCETYNVKSLYAFGSVLTDAYHSKSDINLIVDFTSIPVEDYADNYFALKFSLQDLLKRNIDLLEDQAIKNPYLKASIYNQRQLVYG
jgi:uncharacterized protein